MNYQGTLYWWTDHAPGSLVVSRVTRAEFTNERAIIDWDPDPGSVGGMNHGHLEAQHAHHWLQGYEVSGEEYRSFHLALHDSGSGIRLLEGRWCTWTHNAETTGGWVFLLHSSGESEA